MEQTINIIEMDDFQADNAIRAIEINLNKYFWNPMFIWILIS